MLPSNAPEWEANNSSSGKRGSRRGAGLLLTVVLLLVLGAIVGVAVSRLPTGTTPQPAAVSTQVPSRAASPAALGTTADAPTQQAIKDVIQRLDEAQAQAIATGDQQVMAATATPDFYQVQVSTNQDLVANGVTEVKLVNLEWGDITTDGSAAMATVYETWSTTYDDGTTEQSRDRNVYRLTKDATRGWIVEADDHPDQPALTTPPSGTPSP